MQDYKAGHMIGSTPRSMTIAQLIGAPIGAAALASTYPALVKTYGIVGEHAQLAAPGLAPHRGLRRTAQRRASTSCRPPRCGRCCVGRGPGRDLRGAGDQPAAARAGRRRRPASASACCCRSPRSRPSSSAAPPARSGSAAIRAGQDLPDPARLGPHRRRGNGRGHRPRAPMARPGPEIGTSPSPTCRGAWRLSRFACRRPRRPAMTTPLRHPQLRHRRPHRPRQVDALRSPDPGDRRPDRAGDEGAGARLHGDRARARHHHQGPDRAAGLPRRRRRGLRAQPDGHPRPRRLRL